MGNARIEYGVTPTIITLTEETQWVDEWNYTPVQQLVRKALSGALIIERLFPDEMAGRPMTLKDRWIRLAVVRSLETLRDDNSVLDFDVYLVDGRHFKTVMDHETGSPIETIPLVPRADYTNDPSDPDEYEKYDIFDITLRLIVTEQL